MLKGGLAAVVLAPDIVVAGILAAKKPMFPGEAPVPAGRELWRRGNNGLMTWQPMETGNRGGDRLRLGSTCAN